MNLRLRDIEVSEVRAGGRWRVTAPWDLCSQPLLEAPVVPLAEAPLDSYVVYSVVFVTDSGRVRPALLIRRVGELDYGGDYCEYVDGRWRKVGETPDPGAELFQEFVCNPLESDPSFQATDSDHRAFHRENFQKWASQIG